MNKRLLTFLLLLLPACTPERTVYDAGGNAVSNVLHGPRQMSLEDRFTRNYDATVRTRKNADGVPVSTSSKVSSFQRYFDKAADRETAGQFSKRFEGSRSFATGRYGEASKSFGSDKRYATSANGAFSTDLRPDFMNRSRGIAHNDYRDSDRRWAGEGVAASGTDSRYPTRDSQYSTVNESGYISSKNSHFKQPRIVSSREYLDTDHMNMRSVLRHDNGQTPQEQAEEPAPVPSSEPPQN